MAATKQIILKIAADVAALKSSLNQSRSHISAFAGQVKGMMATAFSVYTVVNFAKNLVNLQAEYSHTISFVNTLTKATEEQKVALDELNKKLGRDTPYTTSQSAEAMQILAQAGLKVNQILTGLPSVLELAQAGNLDLAKAADIAVGSMYGFGKAASDMSYINDILVNTSNKTNQTVGDLGEAFKYIAPFSQMAGVSMEETAASVGILANNMIRGSMAGTSIRQILIQLLSPSAAAKKIITDLGVEVFDAYGNMRSLADIMVQFKEAGISASQVSEIFTARAAAGASVLIREAYNIENFTKEVSEWGTAAKTAAERADNLWGDIKRLASMWEALNFVIAGSNQGAMRVSVQFFTDVIEKIKILIDHVNKLSEAGGGLGKALFFSSTEKMRGPRDRGPFEQWLQDILYLKKEVKSFGTVVGGRDLPYDPLDYQGGHGVVPSKPDPRMIATWQKTEQEMLMDEIRNLREKIVSEQSKTVEDWSVFRDSVRAKQHQMDADAIAWSKGVDKALYDAAEAFTSNAALMDEGAFAITDIFDNVISKLKEKTTSMKDILADFSDQAKSMLSGEIANIFKSFGQTIGESLSGWEEGTATGLQRIALIFLDFLKSVSDFAITLGSILLLIPGAGGLGIGLIAAGTAGEIAASFGKAEINKSIRDKQEEQSLSLNGVVTGENIHLSNQRYTNRLNRS